ncbi:hypothetical protein [Alteromonas sp. 14N.309.X.WAT.G.H12]|uniref:hypothetical protein n=1 Tax=Alteromonas sp. 14N.309.X.WAT.G.H12 TaxID=3120824 RepID=UPI002FD23C15
MKAINGFIDNKINIGIALHFDGYSDCCSTDNQGKPVSIERYDGDLRVIDYAKFNQEDLTHVISLEGGRHEKCVAEQPLYSANDIMVSASLCMR